MKRIPVASVLILIALSATAVSASMDLFSGDIKVLTDAYKTNSIVKVRHPVNNGNNERWNVVYSEQISDSKAGDWIKAYTQFEITNDTGHQVNPTIRIVLAQNSDNCVGSGVEEIMGRGGGGNVHNDIRHHEPLSAVGFYYAKENKGPRRINVCLRVISSKAKSNSTVVVENNDGQFLVVERYRTK